MEGGEMSSFDIYVFRGAGRDCEREVFDHHGRGMPLGKPSSHPEEGEGTGQRCLREPLGCFVTPGGPSAHLTPRLSGVCSPELLPWAPGH